VVDVTLDVVVVSSTDVLDDDDEKDEDDAGGVTGASLRTDTESLSSSATSPDRDQARAMTHTTPRT
jgi:hypothetical protein